MNTTPVFNYKLKTESETIGSGPGALQLKVESLANLNETIDELFKLLECNGNPALLESLCPYFGVVWPSARGLSEYLVEAGEGQLRGRRVLEVGCGLALPSLIAARLGAQVTATDFHPDIPRFLNRNIELNQVENLKYVAWDWQNDPTQAIGQFDWVIGSDILYERQHPAPVAHMLARHVAPGGRAVLADPGRPYLQAFTDEMRKLGFECSVIAKTVRDTPADKDVFVLELSREASPSKGRS